MSDQISTMRAAVAAALKSPLLATMPTARAAIEAMAASIESMHKVQIALMKNQTAIIATLNSDQMVIYRQELERVKGNS